MKLWRCQRGSLWVILAVLLAIGVGAWSYAAHKAAKRREEAQASELRQAQLRAAAERQEQRQREAERIALEERLSQERAQQDALASANKALEAVLTRWDDALRVANSTSRVNLATPVATLQAVRRDAEALTLSPCMDPAKEALVASMQHMIDGFIIWWRNDFKLGNDLAKPDFEAAGKKMEEFKSLRGLCAR